MRHTVHALEVLMWKCFVLKEHTNTESTLLKNLFVCLNRLDKICSRSNQIQKH